MLMKPKLFQKSQKHEKKKKFLSIGEKPQLLVKENLTFSKLQTNLCYVKLQPSKPQIVAVVVRMLLFKVI